MTSDPAYRCTHCGNRTRFDVVERVRRRRYHHYSLGGDLAVDEEEILAREVESVLCRWCDRSDGIETVTPVVDQEA
ncbi:MAG: hypothetical protein R3290_13500 [Acidimicrobiia bacterium]|nr:hypothetical protein [Acidimicrobiia bacterium]